MATENLMQDWGLAKINLIEHNAKLKGSIISEVLVVTLQITKDSAAFLSTRRIIIEIISLTETAG